MSKSTPDLILEVMTSLKAKLEKARDEGPMGDPVSLTPSEAMIAYRFIFGDVRR